MLVSYAQHVTGNQLTHSSTSRTRTHNTFQRTKIQNLLHERDHERFTAYWTTPADAARLLLGKIRAWRHYHDLKRRKQLWNLHVHAMHTHQSLRSRCSSSLPMRRPLENYTNSSAHLNYSIYNRIPECTANMGSSTAIYYRRWRKINFAQFFRRNISVHTKSHLAKIHRQQTLFTPVTFQCVTTVTPNAQRFRAPLRRTTISLLGSLQTSPQFSKS